MLLLNHIDAERLGRLISVLEAYAKSDFQCEVHVNDEDRYFFDLIVSEFMKIKQGLNIRIEFPNSCCAQERPFLESNIAFFISHILFDQPEDSETQEKLAGHLNDCYRCFSVYGKVFKHYFIGKTKSSAKYALDK